MTGKATQRCDRQGSHMHNRMSTAYCPEKPARKRRPHRGGKVFHRHNDHSAKTGQRGWSAKLNAEACSECRGF